MLHEQVGGRQKGKGKVFLKPSPFFRLLLLLRLGKGGSHGGLTSCLPSFFSLSNQAVAAKCAEVLILLGNVLLCSKVQKRDMLSGKHRMRENREAEEGKMEATVGLIRETVCWGFIRRRLRIKEMGKRGWRGRKPSFRPLLLATFSPPPGKNWP